MRGLSEIGLDDNLACREVVDVEFLFTASDIPGVGSELLWREPARIARRQITRRGRRYVVGITDQHGRSVYDAPQLGARLASLLTVLLCASLASAHAEIIGANAPRAVTEDEMKASLGEVDLVGANGAPLDLRALMANGRPTLVSLWAYWCPNCLAEMKGFKAIAAACPDRWNIVFVSARASDYPKDLAKFKTYGLPWKIFRVGDSTKTDVAKAKSARAFYGATADGGVVTPLHYLIGASGRVDAIVDGRLNFAEAQRLAAFCAD